MAFDVFKLRHELLAFAGEMEKRLAAKEYKGGWQRETPEFLIRRIREETNALEAAFKLPKGFEATKEVTKEAADVANFAMMIFDLFGTAPASVAAVDDHMMRLRTILQALQILKEQI